MDNDQNTLGGARKNGGETSSAGEIDELLKDFSKQKEKHVEIFGEIEPPKEGLNKGSGQGNTISKSKKSNAESAKKIKKAKHAQKAPKAIKAAKLKKAEKVEKAEKAEKKPKFSLKDLIAKIKAQRKKLVIGAVCIAVILGLIGGVAAVYDTVTTGYLKPYEKKYPDVKFPTGIKEEYCDYYGSNQNLKGYISIPDCGYAEYILAEGEKTKNPTLEKNNSADSLDFNTVVYINDEKCDLESIYANMNSYLNSSQKITYSTLYEDYEFNVIGAFYTNTDPADDNGYCFPYNFTKQLTGASFRHYEDRLVHRFLYNTDYEISYSSDKLITIAADSDFMKNSKFVVVGVLNAEKQTTAEENDSVHYPQAWYDANKQTNPYRFSSQWYPTVFTDETEEETSVQSQNDF